MSRLLVRGGRVVDPGAGIDATLDVLLADGKVEKLGKRLPARGATAVDARGLVVCPGFIDIHTHLREPGREDKETIASGTAAAAAGGFTAVCAMPNTSPVNDSAGITRAILEKAKAEGAVRVYPIGAITRGQQGEELAELGDLREAGCVAVSDDGKPVASARMMRRALEYAQAFGLVVIDHCEEPTLAEKACMNEGPVATLLGLRAAQAAGEAIMVERNVLLAELTGGRVHIAHLSAAASVDAVRRGKARGVKVTAEVTPHHLFLTDEGVLPEPSRNSQPLDVNAFDSLSEDEQKLIHDTIDALPKSQREALMLLKVEGLSLKQVSEITGASVAAVKVRAFRAYEALRSALGVEGKKIAPPHTATPRRGPRA